MPGTFPILADMERNEAIRKGVKLRELARIGVEGEQDNARAILGAFMQRNGLTDADLDRGADVDPQAVLTEHMSTAKAAEEALMRSPDAWNSYVPPYPRSRYSEMYVRSALRAYKITSDFLGRDTTREDVVAFIVDAVRVANALGI